MPLQYRLMVSEFAWEPFSVQPQPRHLHTKPSFLSRPNTLIPESTAPPACGGECRLRPTSGLDQHSSRMSLGVVSSGRCPSAIIPSSILTLSNPKRLPLRFKPIPGIELFRRHQLLIILRPSLAATCRITVLLLPLARPTSATDSCPSRVSL
ncbi:uncharacterized protein B0I36DRAFT_310413 [Microdochium trichocladiopsis]|uniref:Uncharacterized protein n=1 Tax=Microdochium trichocladiopsis TaxID=1682393 RepID=A0A9P9BTT1_9PEZI|nr:uncharacterized protein B0I36DRAFT_310413 [Microdochium trichocladiopsis]KAH7040301.1 hypothetical protein B0I36DRAFT_310413 [Microdochium trichocladiopsis]